ncbi:MAG: serine/threonine-protein kinase [Gemmataceae bacterium]
MTNADDRKLAEPTTALPVPSSSDGTPTAGGETTPLPSACSSPAAGRYTLVAEIARGGMGTIYRATDTVLGREVAVKVLQDKYEPGSAVARRFAEETRITAQLQHPAIPPVHDLGFFPDGRPFLVMKLIKGETLDELLKRANSAVDRGRFVAAFEQVCQAVAYAHAHDVIHRDLKPANVMVGNFGEVQVMDWGLAKVLGARGESERTTTDPELTTAPTEIRSLRDTDGSFTQAGSVLGTPAYMAPEQAAGEVNKIDTRADVFGLGAILCVLLTGRPPFEGVDAESVRLNAVRGRTEAAFARLDAGGADPELIALCKRCLAFEPKDRPATANAVASEVAELRRAADERARQAEHEKVSAEVRAAEQVKRRRAVQWAAGLVAVVLLLGIIGTIIGLLRAERAKNDAEAAKKVAEEKRAEADATVDFFRKNVFAAARPKGERGLAKDVTLRQAILASLPALESSFKDQPLVEAQLRLTLGVTFVELGDYKSAAQQCERARDLTTEHLGPDHPHTLDSLHNLARAYSGLGRDADALKLMEEVVADRTRVLGPDHRDTLWGLNNLANCYADLGRTTEALRLREEVLEKQKRVLGPDDPATLQSMGRSVPR